MGPILDTMAIVLENIPLSAAMARANMSAIYRTAQVISSIPNKSYLRKVSESLASRSGGGKWGRLGMFSKV